jgi:hypothetical protein
VELSAWTFCGCRYYDYRVIFNVEYFGSETMLWFAYVLLDMLMRRDKEEVFAQLLVNAEFSLCDIAINL